jgi:hypothetical protein
MRRILPILLLLVLGLEPAVPAALASGLLRLSGKADARLPECCRRNGKHHCEMGSEPEQVSAGSKATTVSANDPCPFAPRTLVSTAPTLAALVQSPASSTIRISQLRPLTASHSRPSIGDRRSQPKRGPPALQTL